MANLPIEIKFAQSLAGNEKKIRDKAVKKIRKYLKAKSSSKKDGFTMEDFLKIWKGLHYCMWMQDKALVQEELSNTLSQLMYDLSTTDAQFMFVKVFFMTEAREWNGIDVWRLDKFMMLVRNMLYQSLILVKKHNWQEDLFDKLMSIFGETVMNPVSEDIPDGLRIHFSDIYLDEVEKVGADKLDGAQLVKLLNPFITFLQRTPNMTIAKRVISRVFEPIISRAIEVELAKEKEELEGGEEETEEESPPPYIALQFDNKMLADHLFEISKQDNMLTRNRPLLYDIVKRLQDIENGAIPREEEVEVEGGISSKDVAKAAHALLNLENSKKKKKHKKQSKKSKKNKETGSEGKENDNSDKNNNTPAVNIALTNSESQNEKKNKGKRKLSVSSVPGEEPLTKIKKKNMEDNEQSEDKYTLKKLKDKFDAFKGKSKKEKKIRQSERTDLSNSSKKTKTLIQSSENSKQEQTASSSWTVTPTTTPSSANFENGKKHKSANSSSGKITEQLETPIVKKQKEHLDKSIKTPSKLTEAKDKVSKTPETGGKRKMLSTNKETVEENNLSTADAKTTVIPKIIVKNTDAAVPSKNPSNCTLPEGEVEIWVPNKKYKGNRDNTPNAGFAKFDNSKPPSAFVMKAISKVNKTPSRTGSTPQSTPGSSAGSAKRVVFNMKKNKSQAFTDSLNSPLTPFNPTKTPDQGILKSPLDGAATPDIQGQKSQRGSTNRSSVIATPLVSIGLSKKGSVKKRAMAADFFL